MTENATTDKAGFERDRSDPLATLAQRLSGGDRRSTGAADEIAREVVANPGFASALIELMRHSDPVVRMRAADALEKASRQRPDLLRPHVAALTGEIGATEQQEIRWHVAQMIPRLPLDAGQRAAAIALLKRYLDDRSRIVVVEALSALAQLARDDPALRDWLTSELKRTAIQGSPAMQARARLLLVSLALE